jgi:DNA mismatch repair protein MutS
MDEIGRGTATTDGLAIAWAVMEHLYGALRCRVLFATHFHELAQLQPAFPDMHLATMDVVADVRPHARALPPCLRVSPLLPQQREVLFTHRIVDGVAAHSYGVPCARLAGTARPPPAALC